MRRTCENYSRIKVPYKYQHLITSIDNISRNKDIILIKQDKGRGVWRPRGAILKFENKN